MFELERPNGKRLKTSQIPRILPPVPDLCVMEVSFDFEAASKRAEERTAALLAQSTQSTQSTESTESTQSLEPPKVKKASFSTKTVYNTVKKLGKAHKSGVMVRDICKVVDARPNRVSASLRTLMAARKIVQMEMQFGNYRTYYPAYCWSDDVRPYKTRLAEPLQQAALDVFVAYKQPIHWRVLMNSLHLTEHQTHMMIQRLRDWGLIERCGMSRAAKWQYTGL